MAAHRYWRLFMTESASGDVRVAELSMRTSVGGSNVATGGTPIASSSHPSQTTAQAFDGLSSSSNYWQSGVGGLGKGHWLGYDFGAGNEKDIVEVVADFNSNITQTSTIPTYVRVEFSNDNVTWTPVSPGFPQVATFGVYTYGPLVALGTVRLRSGYVRLNIGWPNPTDFAKRLKGVVLRHRTEDSGLYRINGTIKVDGSPDTPVARLVVLFDQASLRPLMSVWSNPTTGVYEFSKLANKPYMIMSFDYTENFRAVVADRVMPELMT